MYISLSQQPGVSLSIEAYSTKIHLKTDTHCIHYQNEACFNAKMYINLNERLE